MNYKNIFPKQIILILLLFFSTSRLIAQNKFGFGVNLGGGSLAGNFTSQGAFTSAIFVEANPGFGKNFIARLTFLYISDENILLSQSYGRYNSFAKGFSLKGIIIQNMSGNFYLDEGLGLLMLNDRTFQNTNVWDAGGVFSIAGGIDLRNKNKNGFKLGLGVEYGLTFTNTTVRYASVHLQAEYIF